VLYVIVQNIVVEGEPKQDGRLRDAVHNDVRTAMKKALEEAGFEVKVHEAEIRKPWRDEALMVPRKVHMRADTDTDTLCGHHASQKNIVTAKSKVTCKICKRKLDA
jgi:hypothetical protein